MTVIRLTQNGKKQRVLSIELL